MDKVTNDTRLIDAAARMLPWVAACLFAVHVGLVFRHFPPSSFRSANPICSQDLNLRFPACFEGSELLAARGGIWGYSPYYMAGYPFGSWDSFGKRGDEFARLLFPFGTVSQAFYIYIVLTTMLTPVLIGAAARVLGCSRGECMASFVLAILVFQLDSVVSYFWTFGNIVFPFANALGVFYTALLATGVEKRSFPLACAAGAVLGLTGWMHPIVIFPLLLSSFTVVWCYRKGFWRERVVLYPLCAAGIALLLVLPWLAALWRFFPYREAQVTGALRSGWKYLVMDLFSDRAYTHHYDRRALLHVVIVLFALGAICGWRSRPRLRPYIAAAIAALCFTYAFEYTATLKETEPYRFIVSFTLFALIPAAAGMKEFRLLLLRAGNAGRVTALCLGLVLLPSLTAYVLDLGQRAPARGLNAGQWAAVTWMKDHARKDGRVLCYDEDLGDVLPAITHHEVMGGGISRRALLKHKHSWLEARGMFDPPPREFPVGKLDVYLKRYNIQYMIIPGRRFAADLLRVPGCREAFSSGACTVYELDAGRLSYIEGEEGRSQARVSARTNRIRIESPPKGEFVLKYHYLETLKSTEGSTLLPHPIPDDPVPLIRVRNPAGLPVIEISNG